MKDKIIEIADKMYEWSDTHLSSKADLTRKDCFEIVFWLQNQLKTEAEKEVSDEDIEKYFPCEVGQSVIMEKDMTYDDVRLANYYRRQGAKAHRDNLIKKVK